MDPKKIQSLDPKLQEAYQRVMNTPVTPIAQTPQMPPPQFHTPTPLPATPRPQSGHMVTVGGSPTLTPISSQKKSQSSVSPVVLFITAVVFFIVYTIACIKFFNLSVPFLP